MSFNRKRLSKLLALVLRHKPWLFELELDEEGWTDAVLLLTALRRRHEWRDLTMNDLREVVDTSDKRRYELKNGRIRALYGHSLDAKIEKEPAAPPDTLFHGTAPKTAAIIRREGLKPMNRQYVHLSVDTAMAAQVGRRKDRQPVILRIRAGEAHERGVTFYRGNPHVWLADEVPPEFID